VTFVIDPALDYPAYGFVANHAYWVSGLTARTASTTGTIDVVSHGPLTVTLAGCPSTTTAFF
jgi:hypothetical protein